MSRWAREASSVDLAMVAAELQLVLRGLAIQCPACGATGRACRMFRGKSGTRWKCHGCQAHGDGIDLAAHALTGGKLPGGHSPASEQVQAWFAARGWCEGNDHSPPPTPKPKTAPPSMRPTEKRPPPLHEVHALVRSLRPVTADAEVSRWLERRFGLPASAFVERGLVSALAPGPHPRWARVGRRSWHEAGYRAILPVVDPLGRLVSLRARSVLVDPPESKNAFPRGCAAGGMVLANPAARHMLKTASGSGPLVITEGDPSFLAWAIANPGLPVIGIGSGSWSRAFAERVPPGCRDQLIIDVDHDEAGDRYAADIALSFFERRPDPTDADEVLLSKGPDALAVLPPESLASK